MPTIANMMETQIMITTIYYLHLRFLHEIHDLRKSLASRFEITPVSSGPCTKTVIIIQLTGRWKKSKATLAVEAVALKLITDIDIAAKTDRRQMGYTFLDHAHTRQTVLAEGKRREHLQSTSRKHDPEAIFQHCVQGGFELFQLSITVRAHI